MDLFYTSIWLRAQRKCSAKGKARSGKLGISLDGPRLLDFKKGVWDVLEVEPGSNDSTLPSAERENLQHLGKRSAWFFVLHSRSD